MSGGIAQERDFDLQLGLGDRQVADGAGGTDAGTARRVTRLPRWKPAILYRCPGLVAEGSVVEHLRLTPGTPKMRPVRRDMSSRARCQWAGRPATSARNPAEGRKNVAQVGSLGIWDRAPLYDWPGDSTGA